MASKASVMVQARLMTGLQIEAIFPASLLKVDKGLVLGLVCM